MTTTSSAAPEPGPKVVSRFEANLIRIARLCFGHVPPEQARDLLGARLNRPPCLSASCVALVRDSLAKGMIVYLARLGGWRRERFWREGGPIEGRLWERASAGEIKLRFSAHALSFLIWLSSGRGEDSESLWSPPDAELTWADRVLLFLAYEALRETDFVGVLRHRESIRRHALCRLAYPEDFCTLRDLPAADFTPWLNGPGAFVLETLQTALTGHFLAQEQAKGHQGDWNRLRLVSSAQETVLARFVAAVEASGRWDLARCLLQAGSTLLSADLPLSFWTGSLQGNGPQRLAERLEVRRSALGLLRQWLVLRQWAERARGIGYFEDGYAAAQFWLSDWERARGDDVARRVQDVLRRAEPLRPGNQAGANEDEP